jgi:hypothetical protein
MKQILIALLLMIAASAMAQQTGVTHETASERETLQRNFFEFGGSFGMPAGFNFEFGYLAAGVGVRLSGAYWGSLQGVQLSVPVNLYRGKHSTNDIAIAGGFIQQQTTYDHHTGFLGSGPTDYSSSDTYNYSFYGIAYQANWSGFALELGVARSQASATYSGPDGTSMDTPHWIWLPLTHIGYVYQFR